MQDHSHDSAAAGDGTRAAPPSDVRAPLAIIVGFLGAGKTTFLREILPLLEARGLKPFVIINDYANARVDASSLQGANRSVAAINGNCICCDSVTELMNVLLEIPLEPGRVVLIEANGTTDPTALTEHLLVNPELRGRFSPLLQVTVVDANRWQKRHWHNELERLQTRTASHILLTREGEVSKKRFEEVRADVAWLNPESQPTKREPFALLLEAFAKNPSVAPPSRQPAHQHHADHHHLSHAFVGLEVALPDPIGATQLQVWLTSLPSDVFRVKGVVRLTEEPDRWFQFQSVDHLRGEAALFALPAKPLVPPCAVLIGVRLDAAAIHKRLADALEAPGAAQPAAAFPPE